MKAKKTKAQKLGFAAIAGCLLIPIIFLDLIKSSSHQFSILSLQLSIRTFGPLSPVEEAGGGGGGGGGGSEEQTGANLTILPLQLRVVQNKNDSIVDAEITKLPLHLNEQQGQDKSVVGTEMTIKPSDLKEMQDRYKMVADIKQAEELPHVSSEKPEQNHIIESFNSNNKSSIGSEKTKLPPNLNDKQGENKLFIGTEVMKLPQKLEDDENKTIVGKKQEEVSLVSNDKTEENQNIIVEGNNMAQESKLVCDFSEPRSDTCSMLGDIRVVSKSSTIILASPTQSLLPWENSTMKIRPYARKWETPVMQQIKEVSVMRSPDSEHAPPCSVNHAVPAVVFSTGGFLGNFFHDFTDVLVPLFVTSRQFQGEVQFLATDFNSIWIDKYQPILKPLSRYEIINMDTNDQVHCFPKAQVGLLSHKVLGIDASKTPNGYSMSDFKQFLRTTFSLNQGSTTKTSKRSRKKPRLLIILRKGSRSLTNPKEVVAMARSIGYRVITAGPEDTKDLAKFARIVNSCDVMVGVHGAGLANMVFLPANASLIQIIPWGGLKWACWHDFGEPASDMGLNYVEYEIKEEESSLIEEYPRDHAVFKDPLSIHRQGWNALWSIFLDKQKVKLDVGRFRTVLLEIYQSLKQ